MCVCLNAVHTAPCIPLGLLPGRSRATSTCTPLDMSFPCSAGLPAKGRSPAPPGLCHLRSRASWFTQADLSTLPWGSQKQWTCLVMGPSVSLGQEISDSAWHTGLSLSVQSPRDLGGSGRHCGPLSQCALVLQGREAGDKSSVLDSQPGQSRLGYSKFPMMENSILILKLKVASPSPAVLSFARGTVVK